MKRSANRISLPRLIRLLSAIVVLLSLWIADSAWAFNGKDVTAEGLGGVLDLTDHQGRKRTLSDFRGKVVLIFFGYTHCPDVCPTTLIQLNEVVQLLGEASGRAQVLWVTVDPDRDTQELLSHYIPAFNSSFLGLRGSHRQTNRVTGAFNVSYQILRYKGEILVDHSAFGYLIDPKGRTRIRINYNMAPEKIAKDVKALLDGD